MPRNRVDPRPLTLRELILINLPQDNSWILESELFARVKTHRAKLSPKQLHNRLEQFAISTDLVALRAGERGPECKLTDQGSSVRATIKFNE